MKCLFLLQERNPSVRSSTLEVVLKPGDSLTEWCKAFSQSRPNITWYLDGEAVYNGAGYTILHTQLNEGGHQGDEGIQSTLKASSMSVEKTGEYKCVACNIGNCTFQVIRVYIDGE